MDLNIVINELKVHSDKNNLKQIARFSIDPKNSLGVTIPLLRKLAKKLGKNHQLAIELFNCHIREAKILATMVADYRLLTVEQMDSWVSEFDSWDLCDQACGNLFRYSPYAIDKCIEWSKSEKEFTKRAGFALMASLAINKLKFTDSVYINFLPIIIRESMDSRNFVKKAVNWALRQIGKRNIMLNKYAIEAAEKIAKLNFKSAKWISSDALKELKNQGVQARLSTRET